MFNKLLSSMITLGEGTMSVLKDLFIHPVNGVFSFMAEYFALRPSIISIIGMLIAFYMFAIATSAAVLLLRAGVSYAVFKYKEKKRQEILAIRRRERRRTEERLAYDQQFEELYDTYVL